MDLDSLRDASLTLPDLAREAGALAAKLVRADDERVRAAPDERTLRYYQSIGLLDRPVRYDGRVAVYGYRHLLQAVAVKALQGHGYSLAQVQAALAGASTDTLDRAVRDAVHAAPSAPPPVAPPHPPAFRTVELLPGVLVTIDLTRVPEPDALLARLAAVAPTPDPGASR